MNLFELFVKIDADTSKAEKGMKSTQGVSETLTNKIKVMSAQFEAAQKNVDKLTQEFNESVNKAGATDKATLELAKKLAEAEKEAGKFAKELNEVQKEAEQADSALDDCNEEIEDTGEKAEKSGNGLANFAGKLGKGLATAAKIGAAAVGLAAAGITALTTAAVNNYAEYEQLVGGVETLFGQSADAVMKYADNAYKTAGLSANEYMNTVTSFSASLLQSLGGDTAAAAEKADMAITDMSDNANKMGADMASIQNAYQGFAKQNFTMLDNLKLGYGGTKEEMERLLADAEKLSGVKYDISSYADIVDAIHVVQTEMGITGTTAKEAATTIQGSVSAMKSAWTNLVTGLGNDNADIDKLINNLVDSVETAAKNILPRVEKILVGIGSMVEKLAPIIADKLPAMIQAVLPSLLSAGAHLLDGLITGITTSLPQLVEVAAPIVMTLVQSLTEQLPSLIEAGLQVIVTLANGIAESLPELIPTIVDVVIQIVETLIDNVDMLVDSAIAIMIALANGLINSLPTLIEKAPVIISKLVTALVNNAPKLLEAAWTAIQTLVKGLYDNLPEIGNAALQMIDTLVQGLQDLFWKLWDVGVGVVQSIVDGISSVWNDIVSWFNGLWDGLFGNRTANVTVNKKVTGSGVNGSHASGLSYVPFDGYIAELHKGERVLTADEARGYNNRSNNSGYDERPIKIVVQSVLDGKVIGETAYNYNRRKARAGGT